MLILERNRKKKHSKLSLAAPSSSLRSQNTIKCERSEDDINNSELLSKSDKEMQMNTRENENILLKLKNEWN
jgi:hypothetical protein